jgi:hypothetical protein
MTSKTANATATEWWILTGGRFDDDGSRPYSGPYTSDRDAFTARATIERIRGVYDLWIDTRVVPTKTRG